MMLVPHLIHLRILSELIGQCYDDAYYSNNLAGDTIRSTACARLTILFEPIQKYRPTVSNTLYPSTFGIGK